MAMEHVVAVMAFCNVDAIRDALVRSCLRSRSSPSLTSPMASAAPPTHRELANLAKRLKESVWLFGARCDGDVADSAAAFYHSVAATRATDALFLASPSKCALGLALPLSTSRKVSVVLSRHGHDRATATGSCWS